MNVLFVSVDALPVRGGISIMGHHLANAFTDLGHRSVFLGPEDTLVPRDFIRNYLLVEDWESQVRHRDGELGYAEDERIRDLLEKTISNYEIDRVILMHPFYYGIGALQSCRSAGIPCSVYFHGYELRSQMAPGAVKSQRAIVEKRKMHSLRERVFYLIGSVDEILVNSSYTARLFRDFAVKPAVRVTGCGIPPSDFDREMGATRSYDPAARRALRARLGLPSEPLLTYVGRLVPTKRVDRLIALCEREPNLSALIIGIGPQLEQLTALADRRGLRDRVTFAGEVSEERKWQLLRSADFLCLLSEPDPDRGNVEGFGITLLEGAAAGCVPVTSGTGGMVDVVRDDHTGIVLAADDATAVAQLREYTEAPDRMAALAANARTQIQTRFTWTAVADRIMKGWA